MTEAQTRLATALFRIGAIKDKRQSPDGRGFRLKLHEKHPHAPPSPIYLNLRTPDNPKPGPLTPDVVELAGRVLYRRVAFNLIGHARVAGVPRAGEPFAEAFQRAAAANGASVSVIKLVKEDESADGRRCVAGLAPGQEFRQGDTVLLIDDLITGADSKLEAIAALEAAGLKVTDVLVVVDREQGGSRELAERHLYLHAVFTLRQLLGFYREHGMIDEETHREVVAYLEAGR